MKLSEIRTTKELSLFGACQVRWIASRDHVELFRLSGGRVTVKYVGPKVLPQNVAAYVELAPSVIELTVPDATPSVSVKGVTNAPRQA
jgi:hypothetical protein